MIRSHLERCMSLLPLLCLASLASTQCLPKPVVASIENVPLPNGAFVRGIQMAVGTTSQNISMFVSADYNETYIYGSDGLCTKEYSSAACLSFRGGAYDKSDSTSDNSIIGRKQSDGFEAEWVEDTLQFGINTSLSTFGFGIPQQDLNLAYTSQSQLGLGRNSSFLQALKAAGHISTRVYSIFWGLVGGPPDKQTSGSLIFGGLDKALIADQEKNFTGPMTFGDKCGTGLLVTISDILLNWPNGTDMSIFMGSKSAAIQTCIGPGFAGLISLPRSYYRNFKLLAGGDYPGNGDEARSSGINYFTMLFDPSNVYYGGLTIELENSISISVPNTELVVPDAYIASDGAIHSNDSVRNVVINSLQEDNDDDLPVLGRLFLSSAYLMVNQEIEAFSIWQANTGARAAEVIAMGRENNMVSDLCSEEPDRTSVYPTTTPSATSSPRVQATKKMNSGVIVGIVVGTLSAVIIVGVIILFMCRRLGKGVMTDTQDQPELKAGDKKSPTFVNYYSPMHSIMAPSELPGGRLDATELGGRPLVGL